MIPSVSHTLSFFFITVLLLAASTDYETATVVTTDYDTSQLVIFFAFILRLRVSWKHTVKHVPADVKDEINIGKKTIRTMPIFFWD